MRTMDFTFWNQVDKSAYIADDRNNPARAAAAAVFVKAAGRKQRTLLEIGCGPGFDYADHFRGMAKLEYFGIDGSAVMIDHCLETCPSGAFAVGTFETLDLQRRWDFTYAKAVFEHQSHFADPLQRMLTVTRRLAVINWYSPPDDAAAQNRFSEAQRVHYNRYGRTEVLKVITDAGFEATVRRVPGSTNALYVLTRVKPH